MKKIPFPPIKFSSIIKCAALLVSIYISQIACNSNTEKPSQLESPMAKTDSTTDKSDSLCQRIWVAMDIKFKPDISDEIMDNAIRAIKNLLVDSVNKMRLGKFPGFAPNITTKSNHWKAPSIVSITVGTNLSDTTVGPPICKNPCTTHCGVCAMVSRSIGINPIGPLSNKIIEYISFDGEIQNF